MIKVWYILRRDTGKEPDGLSLAIAHATDTVHTNQRGDYLRWLEQPSDRRKVLLWVPDKTNLDKIGELLDARGVEHAPIMGGSDAQPVIGLMIYPTDETRLPDVLRIRG